MSKRRKGTHLYQVIFECGNYRNFLAEDHEDAAFYAMDIAKDHGQTINQIKPYATKKEGLLSENWSEYKDAPDEWFEPILYDQFTDWKLAGWELPSSVACVIRVTDLKTKKTKEYIYQKEGCARKKVQRLIEKGGVEITIADEETIHHFLPQEILNEQHD